MARTKTGIVEFDEMLRGGFLQGDAVLVAGSAGTGKTTLALQYLVNGITQFGERGVYVTFEQLPTQIYRDAENLGWDLRKLEDQGKFRMLCTSPNLMLESEGEQHILTEPIREIQPQRLVVDSLSHLYMYIDEHQLRKEIYRLVMFLKARQLSSLLTWEVSQENNRPTSISDVGTSFLVDCVLLLKHIEIESAVRKAMVILKMRGSDHDKRLREFEVTPHGVRVTGPFAGYEGLITGSPRKVASERFAEFFSGAGKAHSH